MCYFTISNKLFNKFKKNFSCISYDSSCVNFSSLKPNEDVSLQTNISLYNFINDKTKQEESTYKETLIKSLTNVKKNKQSEEASMISDGKEKNLFELFANKFDLKDILSKGDALRLSQKACRCRT